MSTTVIVFYKNQSTQLVHSQHKETVFFSYAGINKQTVIRTRQQHQQDH